MALTTVPASLSATALTLTTAAQPNITSVGTLTGLTVSGNIAGTLTTAAQTNITSLGTLTALTVDDITIDGSTISDAADLTLDVGGDITLDADGGHVKFSDGGTVIGQLRNVNSNLRIQSVVSDKDILFIGNDGGSDITALTLDMSEAGAATFNSDLIVQDGLTVDTGNVVINKSNFSSLPTGSKLNIFGDGITLRLDGSAGTTKTILFRGTNVANPGEVYADGSLRFRTEDANTRITFHTNSSGTNNERMRITSNGSITIGGGDSPRSVGWGDTKLQIEGTGATDSSISIIRNEAGNNPPYFVFAKSRSSSIGSNTVVQNGDDLGTIRWTGADGSDLANQAAQISAQVDGTPGANDMPGRLMFFTSPDGSASAQERMRIDSGGRLRIGTGSYANTQYYAKDVVINAANEGGLTIANSSNQHASYIMFADGVSSGSEQYAGYVEYNHNVDRMRVKSNGTFQIYATAFGQDAFLVRSNGNISLHGPSNDDIGGSGTGIVFTANNQIRVGGNDGTNMYTGYQLMLDRMNTPGDGPQVVLSRNGYFKAAIGGIQGGSGNATSAQGSLAFYTATTSAFNERMRIDSSGKLLHSSTGSALAAVTVESTVRPYQQFDSKPGIVLRGTGTSSYSSAGSIFWGNAVSGSWGTGSYKHFHMYAHEENFHIANRNSRLTYFSQSTGATWLYSSDERLKTDIEDIDLGLTVLNQLKPRKFKWKKDNTEDIGFIAQEVKPLVPIAIDGSGADFEENEDEESGEYHAKILKIGNDKLIPVLVKAIQELSAEVEALKAKVGE